jgi:hypothetical protein
MDAGVKEVARVGVKAAPSASFALTPWILSVTRSQRSRDPQHFCEEETMRRMGFLAAGLAILTLVSGCSTFRDREWGTCAIAGAIVGGAVGGVTGGVAINNTGHPDDGERAGVIVGSTIGGALIGGILGHAICDPIKEPPPPPAPPPPPPAPAPRKIEPQPRRGG